MFGARAVFTSLSIGIGAVAACCEQRLVVVLAVGVDKWI